MPHTYNVRTGDTCRITTGESKNKTTIPVRSYRSVLNAYVNNAEAKFDGPDGKQCSSWTRGMLQRTHIVAGEHRYCGKEFKRKLEQGPLDHELEFKCRLYENGRVVAGPETLRQLASFSERQIREATGVRRDTIRLIRHGKGVKRSTYERVINSLSENVNPDGAGLEGYTGTRYTHPRKYMPYRDPAQRAAWMREYRRRKRTGRTDAPCASPKLCPCPKSTVCTISSIARFAMTMVHVQLRPVEFGTGGPWLSFASRTTAGESGASPATRGSEAQAG